MASAGASLVLLCASLYALAEVLDDYTSRHQLFIFMLIGFEFLGYILVRQLVNVLELFSGCACSASRCAGEGKLTVFWASRARQDGATTYQAAKRADVR